MAKNVDIAAHITAIVAAAERALDARDAELVATAFPLAAETPLDERTPAQDQVIDEVKDFFVTECEQQRTACDATAQMLDDLEAEYRRCVAEIKDLGATASATAAAAESAELAKSQAEAKHADLIASCEFAEKATTAAALVVHDKEAELSQLQALAPLVDSTETTTAAPLLEFATAYKLDATLVDALPTALAAGERSGFQKMVVEELQKAIEAAIVATQAAVDSAKARLQDSEAKLQALQASTEAFVAAELQVAQAAAESATTAAQTARDAFEKCKERSVASRDEMRTAHAELTAQNAAFDTTYQAVAALTVIASWTEDFVPSARWTPARLSCSARSTSERPAKRARLASFGRRGADRMPFATPAPTPAPTPKKPMDADRTPLRMTMDDDDDSKLEQLVEQQVAETKPVEHEQVAEPTLGDEQKVLDSAKETVLAEVQDAAKAEPTAAGVEAVPEGIESDKQQDVLIENTACPALARAASPRRSASRAASPARTPKKNDTPKKHETPKKNETAKLIETATELSAGHARSPSRARSQARSPARKSAAAAPSLVPEPMGA